MLELNSPREVLICFLKILWRKVHPLRYLRDFMVRTFLMLLLRSTLSFLLHPLLSDGLVLFNEDVSLYVNSSRITEVANEVRKG